MSQVSRINKYVTYELNKGLFTLNFCFSSPNQDGEKSNQK